MTDLIAELERLAEEAKREAVTNGSWWTEHSLAYHLRVADGTCPECDPPFIAACSPDVVLRLLAVWRAAKYVAYSNGFDAALPDKIAALRSALSQLEKKEKTK